MKKFIIGLMLCLGLVNIFPKMSGSAFAADLNEETQNTPKIQAETKKADIKAEKEKIKAENKAKKAEIKALKKIYKKTTDEIAIIRALELMKNSPATGAYGKITGDNPTLKPIKIKYKDLGKINAAYRNYSALYRVKLDGIHIYVNSKYKDAPYEAQSAVLAGMTSHVDKKESVNELSYSKALEAFLWNYYLKKNPELKQNSSPLVLSENKLLRLYKESPETSQKIVSAVRKQRPDIKYVWESTGYTHREYQDKMKKLYEAYIAVEKLPDNADLIPVSNCREEKPETQAAKTSAAKENTEEGVKEQYIQEHLRSDVKAKPAPKAD